MNRNFSIWVELAARKRRCSRCSEDIGKGAMFVRMGDREKAKGASCMCASCFEKIMGGLSEEYNGMKAAPPKEVELEPELEFGPKCFSCGLPPERCQCAREAYR